MPPGDSGPGGEIAESSGDDRPGAGKQRVRMAGDLGLRHREAHVGEEAAGPPLADVSFGLVVRFRRRGTDDVDPKLAGGLLKLAQSHRNAS